MKLKVDQNMPEEAAQVLREAGHDAMTTRDQDMTRASDSTIAMVCREEGRAVLTCDLDFGDVRYFPPGDHPGLVILRTKRPDKPTLLLLTRRLVALLESIPLEGKLWIVTEQGCRIR